MAEFLSAGGWSMWFVMLFALLSLAAAIVFAVRADLKKLGVVRAMTWATVFSILSGLLANFLAVMRYVASHEELHKDPPEMAAIVLMGLGETVTPGILGFTILAITWMVVAVGTRRVQDHGE